MNCLIFVFLILLIAVINYSNEEEWNNHISSKKSRLEMLKNSSKQFQHDNDDEQEQNTKMIYGGEAISMRTPRAVNLIEWQSVVAIFRLYILTGPLNNKEYIPYDHMKIYVRQGRTIYPEHVCTGTILNRNHILTAARCFYHLNYTRLEDIRENFLILFGGIPLNRFRNNPNMLRRIFSLRTHNSYLHDESRIVPNDVTLIILSNPIDFNDRIKPVTLIRKYKIYPIVPQSCIAVGYVSNDNNDVQQEVDIALHQIPYPLLWPQERCAQHPYIRDDFVPKKMICAGHDRTNVTMKLTKSDIGGPLFCHEYSRNQFVQFGILSGSITDYSLSIYASIRFYGVWIGKYLNE